MPFSADTVDVVIIYLSPPVTNNYSHQLLSVTAVAVRIQQNKLHYSSGNPNVN